MKYYRRDLLEDSCSLDAEKALLSQHLWNENLKIYHQELEKNKKKLSERFFKIITSPFLHDSLIKEINFYQKDNKLQYDGDITIKFFHNEQEGMIIYYDVKSIIMNIHKMSDLTYLYGEVLLDNNHLWTHGILLSHGEIDIICKKLDWIPSI